MTRSTPTGVGSSRGVEDGDVVGYRYLVREEAKGMLGVCAELTRYVHGGVGTLRSSLETQMAGRIVGETFSTSVHPQAGFSYLGWRRRVTLPLTRFPELMRHQLEPGMRVETNATRGVQCTVWVVRSNDRDVTCDFDPPGSRLRFDISVVSIRRATDAERQNGRPVGRA